MSPLFVLGYTTVVPKPVIHGVDVYTLKGLTKNQVLFIDSDGDPIMMKLTRQGTHDPIGSVEVVLQSLPDHLTEHGMLFVAQSRYPEFVNGNTRH